MKYIFLLMVLAGFMAGCIDDESTGADRAVSTLSFVSELEELPRSTVGWEVRTCLPGC